MINKGHTFSDGDEVTAAKLNNLVDNATITAGTVNPNVLDSSQPVNASAYNVGGTTVIDSSRNIQNAADVSASSFSVGATEIIDSSRNIQNAGTVNAGSANISGSTQFGGAASSYCYLYADTVNLGEDSGSTVNLKGVLTVGEGDPAPSIPAATLVKANDAFLGFSNSAGNKLRKFNLASLQGLIQVATVSDTQPDGTYVGAATTGQWTKRDLGTEVDASNIVAVSNSEMTPVSGTYLVHISGSFFYTGGTQIRFRKTNGTGSTVVASPTVYVNPTQDGESGGSQLTAVGLFSASGSDTYELQYYTDSASVTVGLGYATSNGESEVHAQVTLIKIA